MKIKSLTIVKFIKFKLKTAFNIKKLIINMIKKSKKIIKDYILLNLKFDVTLMNNEIIEINSNSNANSLFILLSSISIDINIILNKVSFNALDYVFFNLNKSLSQFLEHLNELFAQRTKFNKKVIKNVIKII
jgi:hypothetical protein